MTTERHQRPAAGATPHPAVLLTGFGPFPTVPENASAMLMARLPEAAAAAMPDIALHTAVLPTDWRRAPRRLDELLASVRPELVLHFGVAATARGFEIETTARNATCRQLDAADALPPLDCLDRAGPDKLLTNLPARAIVKRLRRRGIAASQSSNAGKYVCNAVLYHSLAHANACQHSMSVGFVHLPDTLAEVDRGSGRSARPAMREAAACDLTWGIAIAGTLEIIAAALSRPPLSRPAATAAASRAKTG